MGSTVVCAFASHRDDTFKNLEHKPKLWPQLLRGRGLMASKGPYCDKQYRRLTVEKIRIGAESLPFLLDTGSRGSFISTFVLPKSRFEDYDEPSMKLLANLMFAETVEQCWQIFPKVIACSVAATQKCCDSQKNPGNSQRNPEKVHVKQRLGVAIVLRL